MMNSLYGTMRTRTFSEIFPTAAEFLTTIKNSGLYNNEITDANLNVLFYELYAEYGNSHIASSDENQFKYKMFSIIYNQGAMWQKNLEVQKRLRDLKEEEILRRGKHISSHAYNPGQLGTRVDSDGNHILDYINDQNAINETGGFIEALSGYMETLADVSTDFIRQFKKLFMTIVNPEVPLWYTEEE